jgi:CRP/FNR family transcriptional regulator
MLCLPAGIERTDLTQLEALVRKPAPLKRGHTLFRFGEEFEYIYVVRSGSLKTVQPCNQGESQIMGFHIPGELLGLDAISDEYHHCDAVALERTSVCAIPLPRLEDIASRIPSLQRQLHRIISREMVHDQEHLAALGRHTARERLAVFLCNLADRLEEAGYSATDLHLTMTRQEIGNYLGVALETVSRLFRKLGNEGLVEISGRQLRIKDPDALARVAGYERRHASGRTAAVRQPRKRA